jgi:glutathione S-transferase
MTIKLYELVGSDASRPFSPHCWKTRMCLAHKDLAFESVPVRFTEVREIENGGCSSVPVIRHGELVVQDSFAIAEYLRETYPDRGKKLFLEEPSAALTRFVESWSQTQLMPWISKWALKDIHDILDEKDQAYFRQSREKRFGQTLEEIVADRESRLPDLKQVLAPVRMTLQRQPFLCGREPGFADFIAFSGFQWLRIVSGLRMIQDEELVSAWIERMLDLHDGQARTVSEAAG